MKDPNQASTALTFTQLQSNTKQITPSQKRKRFAKIRKALKGQE